MRVTIFHNTATDGSGRHLGYQGYQPGHPLVPVFAYTTAPADPEVVAEAAFAAFNADPGMLTGTQRELAEAYRRRNLRSLTPGDVVLAGDTALAVARPAGWQPVTRPLHIVRTGEHGTHPLPLDEVIALTLTHGETETYEDLLRRLALPPQTPPGGNVAEGGGTG